MREKSAKNRRTRRIDLLRRGRSLAATVTAAATTTAISSAATAAPTSAATAFFARPGFVDGERAALVFFFVQAADRFLRGVVIAHLHEAKPLAAAGVAVLHDLRTFDRAELGEELFQIRTANVEAQISDIQSLTHCRTPYVLSQMASEKAGHFAESTPTQSVSFLGRMKAADVAAGQVGQARTDERGDH
jgi:hypothetical protein